MKKTLKSLMFFIGELLFFIAAPCALIWLQYGHSSVVWYKVSASGILLTLLVFLIAKKIFINPLIAKINSQAAQIEITQLSATEKNVINSFKRKFRSLSLWQLIFNLFMPVLITALIMITIKVVEAGAIKMFNVLILCAISIALGVICRICEIFSLRCEHEK